uniref:NADH dehydrogenase subunit 4L n=1 Tax=Oospira sp. RM-2016 TaxID=1885930 RepID=A0A224AA69_9EUPU|nr:NADH dehydrogenase subunit 4L [Oospira sp. RM-2016]
MFFMYLLTCLLLFMFPVFLSTRSFFLVGILNLEAMMLLSLMLVALSTLMVGSQVNSYLLVLTLAVSEAALGLSLLLSFVKLYGNDYIQNSSG